VIIPPALSEFAASARVEGVEGRGSGALVRSVALAAAVLGAAIAWHYHTLGLTLSHYDARGHLVVARRIIDSITPGWQQVGAVWLPLPHLLNAIPVQVDAFYRTGASAVALSIAEYAIAAGAIAWIVQWLTGSTIAAVAAAAVFALNPNVLYLQSTPMTEPLLLATTTVALAMLMYWCANACRPGPLEAALEIGGSERARPTSAAFEIDGARTRPTNATIGIAFALACLTRYEAWPVTVSALVAAAWTRWRRGEALASALREAAAVAAYPAIAVGAWIGIRGATHRYSLFDYCATVGAMVALSVPTFWFGLIGIYIFTLKLGWVPAGNMYTIGDGSVLDYLHHLILPSLVLSLVHVAIWSRYMRTATLDALSQDFVKTARAKGVSERRILLKHVVGNALLPMITLAGMQLPSILTGALVTETVFTWPGMGRLFLDSLGYSDYPVVMGLLIFSAILVVLGNLIADIIIATVDPRIRLG